MRPVNGWALEPERLTIRELLAWAVARPPDTFNTIGKARYVLAVRIFEKFLGWKWCETHLFEAKSGFLYIDFSDTVRADTLSIRITELAENIFTLQNATGFDGCLGRLRTGRVESPQIESTYAEFEFGRVLYYYDIPFRFVPTTVAKTCDFEIAYPDGKLVLADAKCKRETADFSVNTIETSLRGVRDKIPKGGIGIAFIKVPQAWAEDYRSRNEMYREAGRYMKGTSRLVSVKFYAEYLEFDSANVQRSYAFLEATTPRNDVSEGRDWTLFEGRVSYPETGLNITELAKVLSKTFERRRDG